MSDRNRTTLILGASSFIMFSPLAMLLVGFRIPMFENLGFDRNLIASRIAWIIAAVTAIAYVVYTMRAIPFIAGMQREISPFKLLGIFDAVVVVSSKKFFSDAGAWICCCREDSDPYPRS